MDILFGGSTFRFSLAAWNYHMIWLVTAATFGWYWTHLWNHRLADMGSLAEIVHRTLCYTLCGTSSLDRDCWPLHPNRSLAHAISQWYPVWPSMCMQLHWKCAHHPRPCSISTDRSARLDALPSTFQTAMASIVLHIFLCVSPRLSHPSGLLYQYYLWTGMATRTYDSNCGEPMRNETLSLY